MLPLFQVWYAFIGDEKTMDKLKGIEVTGVIKVDGKVNLMLAVEGSSDWWSAEVHKDKKGSYIKLSDKHVNISKTVANKKSNI